MLDQGTPRSVALLLRQAGFDALHTAELDLAEADDLAILRRAATEDRVVITLDADFHALLAISPSLKPSVIRIRIERLRAEPMFRLLQRVIEKCGNDLESGVMVSVQENRMTPAPFADCSADVTLSPGTCP